jgi:GTP 3',8-cyclase
MPRRHKKGVGGMKDYGIDTHKLMYHPERISAWMKGEHIAPIYLEISPYGGCNQRCCFCGLDFLRYKPRKLSFKTLQHQLPLMSNSGVKSIMYAGEGEPLLHPEISQIVKDTKENGIDVAITSNGTIFNIEVLPYLSWIKISVNAASDKTYQKIHGAKSDVLCKVLGNILDMRTYRDQAKSKCTIGVQMVLLPENKNEVLDLACIVKDLGVDYFVVKPYSQHPLSLTKKYKDINYQQLSRIKFGLNDLNGKCKMIFRENTMKKWDEKIKPYPHCNALPFWSYITSTGNVLACSMFFKDRKFILGNINEERFDSILASARREKLVRWARFYMDTSKCRTNCRMDEINRYLWGIEQGCDHKTFI